MQDGRKSPSNLIPEETTSIHVYIRAQAQNRSPPSGISGHDGPENATEITGVAPNPPQDALNGLVLPIVNLQEAGFLTEGAPRTKAILLAQCDLGHWIVHGQVTRYGQWSNISNSGPKYNQTFGAREILDASLSYHRSRWMLTVGANDIGNTYPQQLDSLNDFSGIFPYLNSSPFGFSGAYYYGTVGYHWY